MLMEAVEARAMEQMVDFQTQVRGNVLDLVLTDMPEKVSEIFDDGRLGNSDHCIISLALDLFGPRTEKPSAGPNWAGADFSGMREELGRVNWHEALGDGDANSAWLALKNKLQEQIERHVPPKRQRPQGRPPWLTGEILRAIRHKRRLWRAAKGGPPLTRISSSEQISEKSDSSSQTPV